jgi:hypothetical protein
MKTITPVSVWYNGTPVNADKFLLRCIFSDLIDSATLYYELRYNDQAVTSGNLEIDGSDYTSYNSSSDSNNYLWNWAATQLGLTII